MISFEGLRRLLARLFSHAGRRGVNYVHGPQTLPPPLPPEEEAAAISDIENERSRALLVEHNLRLVVYIAKKFENTGIGIEDLVSIGTIGLIKGVNTFRAERNIKLATYASRCIENEILMYIRRTGSQRGEISIDEPLNVDWDGNELLLSDILGGDEDCVYRDIESSEERRMIARAVSELDPREREIITMRFALDGGKEMTQKEVADKLGISQSYISRLEKRIISRLKEKIGV